MAFFFHVSLRIRIQIYLTISRTVNDSYTYQERVPFISSSEDFPLEIFRLFLLYEMVPTTAENTTLRRTICSPLYILVEQHAHVMVHHIYIYVRTCACIWQERNEETREERMTGSVLRTKGTRNFCAEYFSRPPV